MVEYNGLYNGLICIHPRLNQLDQVSHNLAIGVNTCSLDLALILNVALFNSHSIQIRTKYSLL